MRFILFLSFLSVLSSKEAQKSPTVCIYNVQQDSGMVKVKYLLIPNDTIYIPTMKSVCTNCDNTLCDFCFLFYKYDSSNHTFQKLSCNYDVDPAIWDEHDTLQPFNILRYNYKVAFKESGFFKLLLKCRYTDKKGKYNLISSEPVYFEIPNKADSAGLKKG